MVIGTKQLLQLVKTKKLVEGLDNRELTNPEGAGFDLRIEKLLAIQGESFLGITDRSTADMKEVASYKKTSGKQKIFSIKPNEFYLAKTIENINMPDNLLAIIKPRTTLFRSGISMRTGFCPPGYHGELFFGIYNVGKYSFKIEMGARFAHIVFFEIAGDLIRGYEGQWQGGRSTTKQDTQGLEKQI
ncbi:hypothetical protein HZB78_00515 [Candidatus Collierbacteria bacterium]|nr:hypothetical protein [Candidatus Collierbacteria bacterium]